MTAMAPMAESISAAAAAIAAGRAVIVIDDCAPQPHGALIIAAGHATTKLLAFMVRHSSGFICTALTESECDRLALPLTAPSRETRAPAQRVTVDVKGNGTGISAAARAQTIRALAAPESTTMDFSRPGHVVPVSALPADASGRRGFADAAVALTRLAGCRPVGAYAVMVSEERPFEIADDAESKRFADRYRLSVIRLSETLPLSCF